MAQQQPPGVQIETNMGVFTVELYWNHAPKTCRYVEPAPRARLLFCKSHNRWPLLGAQQFSGTGKPRVL